MKNLIFAGLILGSLCSAMQLQAQSAETRAQPGETRAQPGGSGRSIQAPQFSHSTFYVTDLDQAVNFYKNVMLLPIIAEPFHDGRHVWFKVGEHSQIHIVSGAKERIAHDVSIHTAFTVQSVDEFKKHLASVKYGDFKFTANEVKIRPDGVKQIYFQDPDGYWIEVNDDKN